MDHQFYILTVKTVLRETHDTATLVFDTHPSFPNQYLSGQFLTLKAEIDGNSVRRAYSLSTSPAVDSNLAVTIKKVNGGVMSTWILENAKAGMQIEVMPPLGSFVYQPHTSKKRWFMLYAAGSGITPIFSILKTILSAEPQSFVSLMYGNRTQDDIIFRETLEALVLKYPSRFKMLNTLSQPDVNWFGHQGRIGEAVIQNSLEYLKPVSPFEESHVYLCGPPEMMDLVSQIAVIQGVKKDNIHRESFSSSLDELSKQKTVEAFHITDRKVRILLDGKSYDVAVPAQKTVLEAALDARINMPYSCQSGLCTACRGKCLSGKVHMEAHDGLDDQDVEDGYVLTCMSHPLTDGVEIEMD